MGNRRARVRVGRARHVARPRTGGLSDAVPKRGEDHPPSNGQGDSGCYGCSSWGMADTSLSLAWVCLGQSAWGKIRDEGAVADCAATPQGHELPARQGALTCGSPSSLGPNRAEVPDDRGLAARLRRHPFDGKVKAPSPPCPTSKGQSSRGSSTLLGDTLRDGPLHETLLGGILHHLGLAEQAVEADRGPTSRLPHNIAVRVGFAAPLLVQLCATSGECTSQHSKRNAS